MAFEDGHRVRLLSRTGRDHAAHFPESTGQIAALPPDTRPRRRSLRLRPASRVAVPSAHDPGDEPKTAPVFMAFDTCTYGEGISVSFRCGIAGRRSKTSWTAKRSSTRHGGWSRTASRAWATVQDRGCKGLVAKHAAVPYRPGVTDWLKVKIRREGRFVIGGVIRELRSSGRPALLVGERDRAGLRFWSVVEFGVGRRLAEALRAQRDALPGQHRPSTTYGASAMRSGLSRGGSPTSPTPR